MKIQLRDARFFVGAHSGLREKTVVLTLLLESPVRSSPALEPHFRRQIAALRLGDPLWGVAADHFPGVFVISPNPSHVLANWVVALTLAFQRWARLAVGRGRVLRVTPTSITLAIPWEHEPVFRAALQMAIHHIFLWMQPDPRSEHVAKLSRDFDQWLQKVQATTLSPNTLRFALAAQQRGIPVSMGQDRIQLGWGVHTEVMDSSFTGRTSNVATRIARNKHVTNQLLQRNKVPVPLGVMVATWDKALAFATAQGWPVVVKPSNQDQGTAVTPGIRDEKMLRHAFDQAAQYSPGAVIVEKHVLGDDHRMLVVGGKLLMTTKRIAGGVVGDGAHSITQLIDRVNADPRRGTDKRSILIALSADSEALDCLAEQGLDVNQVVPQGHFVRLRRTANISTGGIAVDVSQHVHPDNRVLAERAARLVGLDIAGVDFLCPDIARSWREVGGAVCEVNAQPGFRPHWLGDPDRDINGEIIDWLFRNKPSRIPTTAITGTNGKSTVSRMLHAIWLSAGKIAGVCTTQGVWIGNDLISTENLSGFPGGQLLLKDPAVQAAVIELPRKGLIIFGHPCDQYDVVALLNVQDDHIGVNGINSLEQMAQLKAQALERATQAVVVNAQDALCLSMLRHAGTDRHILVARSCDIPVMQAHVMRGGEAVCVQNHEDAPWIVLAKGEHVTRVMPLAEIPATMGGLLPLNESNALFAVALAYAHAIDWVAIRQALAGFANTAEQNPGRYNFIPGYPFELLLDYAHNPDGIKTLCDVVSRVQAKRKIVVSLNLGNRSASHIQAAAPTLAQHFDYFVLGQDAGRVMQCKDYAGDDPQEKMLSYFHDQLRACGLSQECMEVVRDESAAIARGLAVAQSGDLVVLLAEEHLALPIILRG